MWNGWLRMMLFAMGAWGVLAFDNDDANDWAYGLEGTSDLSLVNEAFRRVEASTGGYLEQDTAAELWRRARC